MTRGLVVEFLGLPAAGKTTLARAVADRLRAEGRAVQLPAVHAEHPAAGIGNKVSRVALLGTSWLRRPIAQTRALVAVRRTRQGTFADLRTVWENLVTVTAMRERARATDGVHLFDQGLFQAIWSIGLSAATFDPTPHFESVSPPDLLVITTVDQQRGRERLAARAQDDSRLGQRLQAQPRLYVHARQVLEAVRVGAERLAESRPFTVLGLDCSRDEDLEPHVDRVTTAIIEIAAARGSGAR